MDAKSKQIISDTLGIDEEYIDPSCNFVATLPFLWPGLI
jgi:hypothetical protein